MNFYAVKKDRGRKIFRKINIQTADWTKTFFKSSVCDAEIRRNRQTRFALQIFAQSRVKRLSRRRADAIRARSQDQRRTFFGFRHGDEIRQRRHFSRQRIVFHADRQARIYLIRQSVAPFGAVDYVWNKPRSKSPFIFDLSCPAHGATFARSERSGRNARHF